MEKKKFIFDTHCHLADKKFKDEEIINIVEDAKKNGINYILNVGCNHSMNERSLSQAKKFSNLFVAFGIHPNEKDELNKKNLNWIEENINYSKLLAIGEIGLDYYYNITTREKQKKWFKKQLILAKKYELPVLIHIRSKPKDKIIFEDAYKMIKKIGNKKGIFHCFTGDEVIAQKFIDLGFYISLSAIITYKNNYKSDNSYEDWTRIIKFLPLKKIVIETDSPYLIPENLKKKEKINKPSYIIDTLIRISEIKKKDVENVIEQLYKNTQKVLNFESKLIKE